jgi:predicted nucleotidyltransferase
MKLRDRDAILTKEKIIFRVYGYIHPSEAYICDPEYAPPDIFKSSNPRSRRGRYNPTYYKFFSDEGLKLILKEYPNYKIFHEPLHKFLVGVKKSDILEIRKPEIELKKIYQSEPNDKLIKAFNDLFQIILSYSGLHIENFGVFGSILHGFYHPDFSDLDFIVYGKKNFEKLQETLKMLYYENPSLKNEFDDINSVIGKDWKFINYSLKEYLWHQKRKMIYAYFNSKDTGKVVKAEFEPVKNWKENINTYNSSSRILHKGWIKVIAEITNDEEAPFIPSIYQIEIKKILEGPKNVDIRRVFSYMEEFRLQAKKGEQVLIEGNLEKVVDETKEFHQITLSYGPRYYEQAFKVIKPMKS